MPIAETVTDALVVPDAPNIPGLIFRHYRSESDLPLVVAVSNASRAADHIDEVVTVEDIAGLFRPSPNFDPGQDVFIVEVNGEAIAFGRLWWRVENNGSRAYVHVGGVRPEWRRRGIGRTLLRLKERRLREISADHLSGHPRYFQMFVFETEIGAEALVRREGYAPVRHFFEMVRPTLGDIPDAPLPDGLQVRPVAPEHYRAIWQAKDEAFRDHWGAFAATEWHYQNWLNDPTFDPPLWRVAWDGDQVAGMVLGFIHPIENERFGQRRGWTENIAVRRPWRRRGLARALIAQSLHALKERGMSEAALIVDSENLSGALRLYENLGFRPVRRSTAYRKPLE